MIQVELGPMPTSGMFPQLMKEGTINMNRFEIRTELSGRDFFLYHGGCFIFLVSIGGRNGHGWLRVFFNYLYIIH